MVKEKYPEGRSWLSNARLFHEVGESDMGSNLVKVEAHESNSRRLLAGDAN